MIKNERQYRITKTQADKFASAPADAQLREGVDSQLAEIERNALRSQLEELQQELTEYEELKSGKRGVSNKNRKD